MSDSAWSGGTLADKNTNKLMFYHLKSGTVCKLNAFYCEMNGKYSITLFFFGSM